MKIGHPDDMLVEVLGVEPMPGGRQCFVRAWRNGRPLGFGHDGSCGIERVKVMSPPRLITDGLGPVLRVADDGVESVFRYDPDAALLQHLLGVVRIVGKEGSSPWLDRIANTTLTARPAAGANTPFDGRATRGGGDETFTSIRDGAGTDSDTSTGTTVPTRLDASATTDQFARHDRGIFGFDTSSIGAAGTISSATFRLWGSSRATGLGDNAVAIVGATPGSAAGVANSDYGQTGSTEFTAARLTISTATLAGYNDLTLDADGLAAINKTGNTFLACRLGWDFDNSFGGVWASTAITRINFSAADEAGTTQDPELVVEYTSPGGAFGALVSAGLAGPGGLAGRGGGLAG